MKHNELREEDLLACARYVDGECDSEQARAFEQRLEREPKLRAHVDEMRGMCRMFVPEQNASTPQPSAGFQSRVLAEVRRLPTAEQLEDIGQSGALAFESYCRKFLVAAALMIGIGVLVFAGLLRRADTGELQASPEDIRVEMERLDAEITERIDDKTRGR